MSGCGGAEHVAADAARYDDAVEEEADEEQPDPDAPRPDLLQRFGECRAYHVLCMSTIVDVQQAWSLRSHMHMQGRGAKNCLLATMWCCRAVRVPCTIIA